MTRKYSNRYKQNKLNPNAEKQKDSVMTNCSFVVTMRFNKSLNYWIMTEPLPEKEHTYNHLCSLDAVELQAGDRVN
ncbi:hypothetical protein A0J61_08611 [Choanephora cucurbitarum]|uniref:Uncharacterized protein n=1 Tax=Choanephora cucurbitarum TaxID=101091 RepID=A0A1C7N2L4_9FUNG|nr:hypothetical protein A0J61_08611 [Choanephora cucurbitarum]